MISKLEIWLSITIFELALVALLSWVPLNGTPTINAPAAGVPGWVTQFVANLAVMGAMFNAVLVLLLAVWGYISFLLLKDMITPTSSSS